MATITTTCFVVQVQDANGTWVDEGSKYWYTDATTREAIRPTAVAAAQQVVGRMVRRSIALDDTTGDTVTTDTVTNVRDDTTVAVTASKRRWRQMVTVLSTYGDPDIRALVDIVRTACGWTS